MITTHGLLSTLSFLKIDWSSFSGPLSVWREIWRRLSQSSFGESPLSSSAMLCFVGKRQARFYLWRHRLKINSGRGEWVGNLCYWFPGLRTVDRAELKNLCSRKINAQKNTVSTHLLSTFGGVRSWLLVVSNYAPDVEPSTSCNVCHVSIHGG